MALTTPGGHGLGLKLDVPRDPHLWAWPMAPLTAPPAQPIDLSGGFPFGPQAQGQEGSCTSFAGAACLEWLLAAGDTPGSVVKLAEAFIYFNNRREDGSLTSQDTGASSQSIAKGLAQFGAATADLMPYRAGDYARAPSVAAYQDALGRRILRYYQVSGDLLGGVWAALSGGIVLCMGFQVPRSFETSVGSDGKVPAPSGNDPILGGHEVVICGWIPDSTAPGGLGYIKVRNSWGPGMGLGGYYLIPTVYWSAGLVMDHMVLAFETPPAPLPPPPPPGPPAWQQTLTEVHGMTAEVQRLVKVAQAEFQAAQTAGRPVSHAVMNGAVGPIWDYANQLNASADQLVTFIK